MSLSYTALGIKLLPLAILLGHAGTLDYITDSSFILGHTFLVYTLIKINSVHCRMCLYICIKEASKSHWSKKKALQTSQHPWPFPHFCSLLPMQTYTEPKDLQSRKTNGVPQGIRTGSHLYSDKALFNIRVNPIFTDHVERLCNNELLKHK